MSTTIVHTPAAIMPKGIYRWDGEVLELVTDGRGGSVFEGRVTIDLEDVSTGKRVRHIDEKPNLVTRSGKNVMRDMLLASRVEPTSIAVGTGVVDPDLSDTLLGAEVFRGLITRRSSVNQKAKFQTLLDTDEANGSLITEAGLFNTTTSNTPTLIARIVFGGFQKTSSIQATISWDIIWI